MTTPPLPGFLNSLAGPLNHFGLWAVLLFVLIEDFGIPVPGETILIAASVYAGTGRLNVVAVAAVGFIAAVTGDNIGFAIGHFGGRALALRWGHYVFLTEARLDKAAGFFDRHGAWIITVARFIEGLRQANGIVAGITAPWPPVRYSSSPGRRRHWRPRRPARPAVTARDPARPAVR